MPSFKSSNGTVHTIDSANNHFIGAKCVNPLAKSPNKIGSTIPKDLIPLPEVLGKVPFRIGENGEFIRL